MEKVSFLTGETFAIDSSFLVTVVVVIGGYLAKTGREKSALTLYHGVLEVLKPNTPDEGIEVLKGVIYACMAQVCYDIYDLKETIKYAKMSVAIQKTLPTKFPAAYKWKTYSALGRVYTTLGDYTKAIESHEQALDYTTDSIQNAQSCTFIGESYLALGNNEKAAEYIKRSRDIARGGVTRECAYNSILVEGHIFCVTGDDKKAIACFKQALAMSEEMEDKRGECTANSLLGYAYTKMDPQKALKCHAQAFNLGKKLGYKDLQVGICIRTGKTYMLLGDFRKATEYFKMATDLCEQIEYNHYKSVCYTSIGIIHEEHKEFKGAIAAYEKCVQHSEEIEEILGNKDEHKVSISNRHGMSYYHLSRMLIKDKQQMKALVIADRGRTRALADLMRSNYGIQTTSGSQGKMLSHNEIQQIAAMVSRNTILLISINFDKVYFWVVQPDGSIVFRETTTEPQEMQPIECIKRIVDKAYAEIGDPKFEVKCEDRSLPDLVNGQNPRKSQPIATQTKAFARDPSLSNREHRHTADTSLTALYDVIIAPVADLLHDGNKDDTTEELVFAPDGPLCLAPFAALQGPDGTHLCDKFRIRVIPSLTTLNHIQNCPAGYHSNTGALIVGDPNVGDVLYNGTAIHLDRLPAARKEAEMIGALLKVEPLTGDKATKEEVLHRMASVSLVHLAAHGHPDRGEIALAPNPSARSGIIKEKDYLLSMADVLGAKLRAKLVVLSCCHSGRGEIKGEGVVGIARAFLGAGARSVLVSLWAIDDEATLYFMQHFYQHLVQGESASAALHQATRELKHSENFSETRHWAPFLLIGDDVKISV